MEEEDDWKQCAEWLNRCQVIPDDHPVLSKTGNAIHLVQALMDGVTLCHVLSALSCKEIDISAMKDFSPNPQYSQFLCCQNIRLFLHLCEKEFAIPRTYLVHPNDIYQARNFAKAIALLSRLSLSPRAQRSGITGFPADNSKLQIAHEYYNNLELTTLDTMVTSDKTNYAQMDEETKEKLYDTVVHQVTVSRQVQSSEKNSARVSCIREIIDTERNYVDLLKMLLDKYKIPLTGVLSAEELDEVLKYIQDLYTVHRELLNSLIVATTVNVNSTTISGVFLQERDKLLIYGAYCGHMQRAQSLVVELMRNDVEKRTRIDKCQANSDKYKKFHLTELLTIPIQRVLKYHLLLDQLCKLTPADHPERANLLRAHEAMKELAQSINEVKRDLDTISAIDQIQASILDISLPQDKKLSCYGRRHMDGELKVLSQPDLKAKVRYLFLFDKALLICKTKGDSFTFKLAYRIVNRTFEDIHLPLKKGEKYSFGFTLPISTDNSSGNVVFLCKSSEMRKTWMKAAQTAVSNLFPPGAKNKGYNFEMETFKCPTYCCVCGKLLLGIFYQGYRCRETNLTAHKACLVSKEFPPRPPHENHVNGFHTSGVVQIPPLPPQSATPGTRRLHPSSSRLSSNLPAGLSCRVSSPSTMSSTLSQSDSLDLSRFSDATNTVSRWLDETSMLQQPRPYTSDGWFQKQVYESSSGRPNRATIDEANNFNRLSSQPPLPSSGCIGTTPRHRHSLSLETPSWSTFDPEQPHHQHHIEEQLHSTLKLNDPSVEYDWYVGEMDRSESVELLNSCRSGTFLVRVSKSAERMGEYSLSVVCGYPRHIRIQQFISSDGLSTAYGLCELEKFPSIATLVDHYSHVSLNRCFDEVDIKLLYPYQRCPSSPLFFVRANYDFTDEKKGLLLSLKREDRIAVVSRAAEDRGWWKGWLCGRVGFFPMSYVSRETANSS